MNERIEREASHLYTVLKPYQQDGKRLKYLKCMTFLFETRPQWRLWTVWNNNNSANNATNHNRNKTNKISTYIYLYLYLSSLFVYQYMFILHRSLATIWALYWFIFNENIQQTNILPNLFFLRLHSILMGKCWKICVFLSFFLFAMNVNVQTNNKF